MHRALIPSVCAIAVAFLATLGCDGDDGTGPPVVATVVVTPDSTDVQAGGTVQFSATARDASGNTITGVSFTWSSADQAVATVNNTTGLATGVVMGKTQIRATTGTITGSGVLRVVPNANADAPDDLFMDTNGDGIDGDIAKAVFVATTGSDANPGTPSQPKATIGAAITAAVADANKTEVYVSQGTYSGSVTLANGISVYGGYNAAANWARSFSNTATIQGDTTAVSGSSITLRTVVDLLTIVSADNTAAGGNSTGIYIADSNPVVLRNLTVNAGNGAPGAAGTPGPVGIAGNPGQNGSIPGGGLGGDPAPGPVQSGKGGDGGNGSNTIGVDGGNGQPGLPIPGGGAGGFGGPDPDPFNLDVCPLDGMPGIPGSLGASGVIGTAGAGGDANGSVAGGFWLGSPGADGGLGNPGFGGGGGGGGSAGRELTGGAICQPLQGGGGGGGGSGGQGGEPGIGSAGGGGSFAVFVFNSTVEIEASTLTAGNGGDGGAGALGGAGGQGGPGGAGSLGDVSQAGFMGGPGGDGGVGGPGGDGGPSGGGGGGISYAVYGAGSFTVTSTGTTLTPGTGGAGGIAPAGGNDGATGATGEKNF